MRLPDPALLSDYHSVVRALASANTTDHDGDCVLCGETVCDVEDAHDFKCLVSKARRVLARRSP